MEHITEGSFSGCSALASVLFEEGSALTDIGGCYTAATGGGYVVSEPGRGAFNGCAITSLTLPESVTTLYKGAFQDCALLESVTLPAGLTKLGVDAFKNCVKLAGVTWPDNAGFTSVSGFAGCTALPCSVYDALPQSVTAIGESAFAGCSFTALTIPARIESVGEDAFDSCSRITALTIEPGLKTIGIGAFSGCEGLAGKTIDVPATVTSVGSWAFGLGGGWNVDSIPVTTVIFRNPDVAFDNIYYGGVVSGSVSNPENSSEKLADVFGAAACGLSLVGYASKTTGGESDVYKYSAWVDGTPCSDGVNYNCPFTDITAFAEYTVSGTAPAGALVGIRRGGEEAAVTRDGTAFSARVRGGADVLVTVSEEGYYSEFFAKSAAALTAAMGLDTGDYASAVIEVTDGSTAETSLAVPVLDTTALSSILDAGKCCVTVDNSAVVTGLDFTVRVFYALKSAASGTVTVSLPADAAVSGVYSDSETLSVTPSGNTLAIPATARSGALYIRMSVSNTGAHSVGAAMSSGGVTAPLGSSSFDAQAVRILTDSKYTTEKSVRVTVVTAPGADVGLYLDGADAPAAEGRANLTGRCSAVLDLGDIQPGGSADIRAASGAGETETCVVYLPGDTELKELRFVHAGSSYTLTGTNPPAYYRYVANGDEANNYWSFSATLSCGDAIDAESVMMNVVMADGSFRSEPMTQLSESEGGGRHIYNYAAEMYIEPAGDHVFDESVIPVSFSVDFDYALAPYVPDAEGIAARAAAREEARAQALEDAGFAPNPTPPTQDELRSQLREMFGYASQDADTQAKLDTLIADWLADGYTGHEAFCQVLF